MKKILIISLLFTASFVSLAQEDVEEVVGEVARTDSVAGMFEDRGTRATVEVLWKRNRAEESVFGKERSVREERVR